MERITPYFQSSNGERKRLSISGTAFCQQTHECSSGTVYPIPPLVACVETFSVFCTNNLILPRNITMAKDMPGNTAGRSHKHYYWAIFVVIIFRLNLYYILSRARASNLCEKIPSSFLCPLCEFIHYWWLTRYNTRANNIVISYRLYIYMHAYNPLARPRKISAAEFIGVMYIIVVDKIQEKTTR